MYGLTIFVGGAVDGRNEDEAIEARAFLDKLEEMVREHNGEYGVVGLVCKVYNGTAYQADDDDDGEKDEEVLLHSMFEAMDEKVAREGKRCTCNTCKAQWRIRERYVAGEIPSGEAVTLIFALVTRREREQAEEKFAAFRATMGNMLMN